jgi:formamidopyrimidine-DNA glycosylase
MPELPEVELIARSLNSLVAGRTIVSALLLRERLAPSTPPEVFASQLSSVKINFVHRRGKHILFDLSRGQTLMVHLRMSGRFSRLQSEDLDPKFTHAVFYLDGGERLVFDDQRHFGFMRISSTDGLWTTKELVKLAPEPFSNEFSPDYLFAACRAYRRSLKELLLDQARVCGLGNIYACEAMFLAGTDPRKPARRLPKAKVTELHRSIIDVLAAAISHAESRTVDPSNLQGSYFSGLDEASWYVYDRENDACTKCGHMIARIRQSGRSTYFCGKCQKR